LQYPATVRSVLLILVVACSHADRPTPAASRPASAPAPAADAGPIAAPRPLVTHDPRYFTEQGAPDPLACTNDKDCIGDTVVDKGGCCVVAGDPLPQTWAWHTWITERRMSETCHEAKCPPVPVPPSMPQACLLEARCVGGACQNSCAAAPK
jgi:hypothetical protein